MVRHQAKYLLLAKTGISSVLALCMTIACSGSTPVDLSAEATAPPGAKDAFSTDTGVASADSPTRAAVLGQAPSLIESNLVAIPDDLASRSGMYAHPAALDAFRLMHQAAQSDGVELRIVSAFRSFADQKRIWERKWTGKAPVAGKSLPATHPDGVDRAREILRYSAMPGTSRHHWGTDFDINSVDPSYFDTRQGQAVYRWLSQHAPSYGFCQTYTAKAGTARKGYEEEKWHWSFIPVARTYQAAYLQLVPPDLKLDFLGVDTAAEIGVVDYITGIDHACLA